MKRLFLDDINLQRFAEDEGQTDDQSQEVDGEERDEDQESKTYSQEELDQAIKKATDGFVSQEKVDQIIAQTIAKERKRAEEAERLSKLSEAERAKEQAKLDKEEIEELKAKLARKDLEADTVAELKEQDLPIEFMDFLIAEDGEKTLARIKDFKPIYLDAIQREVEKRYKGVSPKGSNTVSGKAKNKKSIGDYASKQRII